MRRFKFRRRFDLYFEIGGQEINVVIRHFDEHI